MKSKASQKFWKHFRQLPVAKDRPVLVAALTWADVLLTLDRADFIGLLGSACYGMPILLPSEFLARERAAGRI